LQWVNLGGETERVNRLKKLPRARYASDLKAGSGELGNGLGRLLLYVFNIQSVLIEIDIRLASRLKVSVCCPLSIFKRFILHFVPFLIW